MPGKTVSIRAKLLMMVLLVGVVTGGIVTAALVQMKRANSAVTEAVSVAGQKVLFAWKAKEAIIEASNLQQNLILANSNEEIRALSEQIDEYRRSLTESLQTLEPLLTAEESMRLAEFKKLWAEWEDYFQEIRRLDLLAEEGGDSMATLVRQGNESYRRFNNALSELLVLEETLSLDSRRPALDDQQRLWLQERRSTLLVRLKASSRRLRATEEIQAVAIATGDGSVSDGPFAQVLSEVERDLKLLDPFLSSHHRPSYDRAVASFNSYAAAQQAFFERISRSGTQSAYTIFTRLSRPLVERCGQILSSIVETSSLTMQRSQRHAEEIFYSSQMAFLVIGVVGIVVAVFAAARTVRGISEQIEKLRRYLREIQRSGDLSKKVPQLEADEIGELAKSFEHMRSSLFKKESELSRANRRLSYSNKRLEEKRKEMEQFVYTVSHDLKSPLVTCKGFVGLLREDLGEDLTEDAADSITRIEGACNNMSQIIDDLLELSRLSGRTEPNTLNDLNEILFDLKEAFEPRLDHHGVSLEIQDDLPEVYAVRSMIYRCIENLISNAIKYGKSAEDGSVIKVGDYADDKEVFLFVSDNGPGIEPEYHEKVFGLFQRLERTMPGTGIGLASVAKIMQLHQGRAWVESERGAGATFWLAFPSEEGAKQQASSSGIQATG